MIVAMLVAQLCGIFHPPDNKELSHSNVLDCDKDYILMRSSIFDKMWMRTVKYDEVIVMMLMEVYNKNFFDDICHKGGGRLACY